MPNLHAFASEGVTFGDHHAVFPTVTRANVVSMLTGTSPGAHGLTANTLVMRDFDDTRVIPAMAPELARVQQAGELLLSPHLADILATHGRRSVAIGTGTSGNAFLQSPNASRSGGATVNPGFTNPPELQEELTQRFGAWPDKTGAGGERLAHAVTLLTEHLIPKYEPAVAVFWSNQPDSAQHAAGVGSDLSELVVAIADRQFGRLLVWLEATGRAAETDVVVISDHGYSTLADSVDVEALLRDGLGAEVGRTMLVAPNGGAVLFYVRDSDPAVIDHLAGWLMAHPWCGAVAASEAAGHVEGTVPAALVGIEGPRAPDLAMSFAWESRPNEAGFEGTIAGKGRPGIGQHGSMSRHEMRCVLTARGPSFGAGLRLDTPSGHVDLAPTLLRVLDLPGGEQMHGRVLEEALVGGPSHEPVAATKTLKAERVWRSGSYRQAVTVTRVGDTTYVDEGNRVAEGKTT
jgi:predicted AlkP superfamily pyrophosphatase or phosphodiesterase